MVTIFYVLIIVATKLFLLGFCYELLQQIHKHRIHHKTHQWYYYYWGAQVLIICTLAVVIYFEVTKQRNRIALNLFFSSFGVDILAVLLLVIIGCLCYTSADCCGCNTCCFGCFKWCKQQCHVWNYCNFLCELFCNWLKNGCKYQYRRFENNEEIGHIGDTPPSTSIVDECVPPPLTSFFQCCPFCCCSCEPSYCKVFCLCCLPICTKSCSCHDNNYCKCSSTACCICKCCGCWCCNACGIPCCTYLPSGNEEDDEDDPLYNNKSCKFCVNKWKECDNFSWEKCGNCWEIGWTVFTNIVSLITFLAFVSYLSQAFPAIVISYYLSPTASLIRLGFFEVVIVVLLFEVAYILFLIDKLTWLCYFKKYKKIPEEIKVNVHNDAPAADSAKHKTFISQYTNQDESDLIYNNVCGCEHCHYPARHCCSCKMKYEWSRECCKQMKFCHWLFPLTVIQIITMAFIIALSAALLFFLLNVVIQQTSGSDNEFKDILAIVPTIALNLWLLFRQGDLCKAVKNIISKANKTLDDPHSDAERGHAHHHLLHHGSISHPPDSVF